MTSDHDKCGISSLLPMSCRGGRAEDFARRLQSRLRSLGSQDGNCTTDESSWLAANENPVAVSQPRHSADADMYFDFGLLESPGSPEEELPETEMTRLMTHNKDNLHLTHCEDCHCPKIKDNSLNLSTSIRTSSQDSDSSDGAYYDPESDAEKMLANHLNGVCPEKNGCHSLDSCSTGDSSLTQHNEAETLETDTTASTEATGSPEEGQPHNFSITQNSDESTLSLKDEEYPSLEYNSCAQELSEVDTTQADNLENDLEKCIVEELSASELQASTCEFQPSANEWQPSANEWQPSACELQRSACDFQASSCECDSNILVNTCELKCDEGKDANANDEASTHEQVSEYTQTSDEADGDDERIPRVRRCSSLKTGKTPPGTPGRKKIVRFADVLGLDLADVRTFLDEIPKIPTSAYNDLVDADLSTSASDGSLCSSLDKYHINKVEKVLVPLFQQPGGQPDFMERVKEAQVCLENAIVEDPVALSIKGIVRVKNLDFNKSVHIRYSLDSWKSYADLQGQYIQNSCDGFSDTFSFLLYAHTLTVGQRIEFAVRFQCKGCQFWDSNRGANYCFQCLPASNNTPYMPITGLDDQLGAAFYYESHNPTEGDTSSEESLIV